MNPTFKTDVENRIKDLNFTNMFTPTKKELDKVKTDVRIPTSLCHNSDRFFEWCFMQRAEFGPTHFNCVEIAYMLGVQPIVIAKYVNEFGRDWSTHLLERNIFRINRKALTVLKIGTRYWTLNLLQTLLGRAKAKTSIQVKAKRWADHPLSSDGTPFEATIYTMTHDKVFVSLFKMPTMPDAHTTYREIPKFTQYDLREGFIDDISVVGSYRPMGD